MIRFGSILIATALASLLAACDMQPDFNVRPDWTPTQAPKTNEVSVIHRDAVIPFAPGTAKRRSA